MVKFGLIMIMVFVIIFIVKKAIIEFNKAGLEGTIEDIDVLNAQYDSVKDIDVEDIEKKKKKIEQVTK
jgi:hypothetical protein